MRETSFQDALREASDQLLEIDPRVYLMGLGVPDPKGLFGTTLGLQEKYGPNRVMDMPTSENGMTGIAIGSAIVGMRPIMTHQRVDFFLLALDQLINNGAKWNYMFGGEMNVPLVIRLVIGRGWGQGPQHSQTLFSLFTHIPGLKVVAPATPYDAKGLLIAAVQEENPVVFFEHRWLHGIYGPVPEEVYTVPIGKAKVIREGSDLTLVSFSHMTLEAWQAAQLLEKEGISAEVIDLRSLKPLDKETILESVRKTGRILIAEPDWKTGGVAAEVIAFLAEEGFGLLKSPPRRVAYPDRYSPSSWALANHFYPTKGEIAAACLEMLGRPTRARTLLEALLKEKMQGPLDVPDKNFTGPF